MGLLGIVSSPDPIVHDYQSSPILRFREHTSLNSLVQIGRSIRTNSSSRPHSSNNDYRLSTVDGSIHEESRFLKSIGPMGDNHRING
jgi:hypothetical protein